MHTEAGDALLAATEALLPLVQAYGEQIEADRQLPPPVVEALTQAGLFKLFVPKALGGSEIDPGTYCRAVERLGQVDGSTGWVVSLAAIVGAAAASLDEAVASEIFGAPNACVVGSLAPAPHADQRPPDRAEMVEGGYRVTSRWAFGSGCLHATWIFGVTQVYAGGEPHRDLNGNLESRYFFMPITACQLIDTWQVAGLRGSGSYDFAVVDHFVPARYTLPRNNSLRPRDPSPLYTFAVGTSPDPKTAGPWVGLASIGISALCLGIARGALDALRTLATVKTPRSTTGLLANNPIFQDQLGRAEATLGAGRAYLYETIASVWQRVLTDGLCPPQDHVRLRLASVHGATLAAQVVDLTWQAAGASAIFTSNPFERRFRDIHAITQNIAIRPDIYSAAGRSLLGVE